MHLKMPLQSNNVILASPWRCFFSARLEVYEMYFTRSAGAVSVTGIEKVKKLTVRVVVQDCTGTVRFTDIMLQGGSVATAWVSHVSEQRYTFDAQEV